MEDLAILQPVGEGGNVATQTAEVIDLAPYRKARIRRTAPAAPEVMPPVFPALALPFPLLPPPLPGFWLFWVPVLLPQYFAPSGAMIDAN